MGLPRSSVLAFQSRLTPTWSFCEFASRGSAVRYHQALSSQTLWGSARRKTCDLASCAGAQPVTTSVKFVVCVIQSVCGMNCWTSLITTLWKLHFCCHTQLICDDVRVWEDVSISLYLGALGEMCQFGVLENLLASVPSFYSLPRFFLFNRNMLMNKVLLFSDFI